MAIALSFPAAESREFLIAEAMLVLFNAIDAIFTVTWLCTGLACEANPILRAAWQVSPALFVALKSSLIHGGTAILHRTRNHPGARRAMFSFSALYGAVVAWHLLHALLVYS